MNPARSEQERRVRFKDAIGAGRVRKPRWDFNIPLPKTVRLPGVTIEVQVGPRKFGADGAWVYDVQAGQAVILIDENLPDPVRFYTLVHELQHALVDLLDQAIERAPELVKTKHMAGYISPAPPSEAPKGGLTDELRVREATREMDNCGPR